MPNHVSWSSIELLHNVVRTLRHLHDLDGRPLPRVRYRAKVKLHGSNCAVQVGADGVHAQSRTQMLTPGSGDYKGFASWALHTGEAPGGGLRGYFDGLRHGPISVLGAPRVTVFGEWCGPGVEKGMAVSLVTSKLFAVFGVQVGVGEGARVVFDPDEVGAILGTTPEGVHVLPWEGLEFKVDFGSEASLKAAADLVSRAVEEVEKRDPWVHRTFGIDGLGEGLVLYPVEVDGVLPACDPESLARLMWKAKGEKHRVAGARQAAQVDATVASGVDGFVTLMVTDARLEQGLAACGGDRHPKGTGRFLSWVSDDVRKESVAELEASGLTWDLVSKAVQVRARTWFLSSS